MHLVTSLIEKHVKRFDRLIEEGRRVLNRPYMLVRVLSYITSLPWLKLTILFLLSDILVKVTLTILGCMVILDLPWY